MHSKARPSVGVVGASGYTGMEVLHLLSAHDDVQVTFATSESQAGESAGAGGLTLMHAEDAPLAEVDVVMLCLPHGQAVSWTQRGLAAGAKVIDLTADHRPGSGREAGAVYGMADVAAGEVAGATLVANPGCYATGAQLALGPLLEADLLDGSRAVVINGASGVTGAGRSPKRNLLFAEVAGNFEAYSLGNGHRHLLEMTRRLPGLHLIFQPHLLPVPRGILETIYVPVRTGVDEGAVREAWGSAYARAATISVLGEGAPSTRDVVGTDRLDLGVSANEGVPDVLTVVAALDNLGKGAAGQAVHNMNLMLGLAPERGLRC